jgi:acyl-coenzyme A synthetase/AMP-(fatty) acid ligase
MNNHEISPFDLERIISKDNKIRDVVVIGVNALMRDGQVTKAFIVPVPGYTLDEDEIKKTTNKRIIKEKRLEYIKIIRSIPRNQYGKLLPQEIRKYHITGFNFYWQ